MIDKKQIETILKINGLATTSPDEEVRSMLLSARYNKDEVDNALKVLRENVVSDTTCVDGMHKVFRSDNTLRPVEITQLLGVDVDIDETLGEIRHTRNIGKLQSFIIVAVAIICAFSVIAYFMHEYKVGFFHHTSNIEWGL